MIEEKKRWLALYMLCAGELMIVLDTTVVNKFALFTDPEGRMMGLWKPKAR